MERVPDGDARGAAEFVGMQDAFDHVARVEAFLAQDAWKEPATQGRGDPPAIQLRSKGMDRAFGQFPSFVDEEEIGQVFRLGACPPPVPPRAARGLMEKEGVATVDRFIGQSYAGLSARGGKRLHAHLEFSQGIEFDSKPSRFSRGESPSFLIDENIQIGAVQGDREIRGGGNEAVHMALAPGELRAIPRQAGEKGEWGGIAQEEIGFVDPLLPLLQ
jgi:hypothetical protein